MKKKSQKTTFFRFFATFSKFAWIQMRPFCGPAPQTISCLRRYSNSTYIIHMSLAHNNIRARGPRWCAEKNFELKIFKKFQNEKKKRKNQIFDPPNKSDCTGTSAPVLKSEPHSIRAQRGSRWAFSAIFGVPPVRRKVRRAVAKVGCSRRFVSLLILTPIQRCTSPKYSFGWGSNLKRFL